MPPSLAGSLVEQDGTGADLGSSPSAVANGVAMGKFLLSLDSVTFCYTREG